MTEFNHHVAWLKQWERQYVHCHRNFCAVYRKITNGFRSEWGAAFYADIRSVVETARRRSIRAIDAIRLTLQGRPLPCVA